MGHDDAKLKLTCLDQQIVDVVVEIFRGFVDPEKGWTPLAGLEWFLALTLWFFNATCWGAWFGYRTGAPIKTHDTVTHWLTQDDMSEPEHCAVLYERYRLWCERNRKTPLAKYSFYARLVELGAEKFRDGRNGPTKYVMPASLRD